MIHVEYGDKAPSVVMLRKVIRQADAKGEDTVIFERGEQHSRFEKHGGRWYHYGNGFLKAGYKLDDMLTAEYFNARRF